MTEQECTAALIIAGEHFPCDNQGIDHTGWPHANRAAQAVWGDGDANGDAALAISDALGNPNPTTPEGTA